MSLESVLLAIRLSPLLFVPLVPLRSYVPYSVERTEMQAKEAEAQARALLWLSPPVSQTDLYLAGELPWHKYDEDLALVRRQIERCRQNSIGTNAKTRKLGCWIQRTKLRAKHGLMWMGKLMVGLAANVINGVRGPGGFFYLLQLIVIAAGAGAGVRWSYNNALPVLVEFTSQYMPANSSEPEKMATKPYIGRLKSSADISPSIIKSDTTERGWAPAPPPPSRCVVDSELEDGSDTNITKPHISFASTGGRHVDLLSSSEECLSESNIVRDSPRGMTMTKQKDSPRGNMDMYEHIDLPSSQDIGVSSPSFDRPSSPARAKKRVAFQDEDRLPRAGPRGSAPSGISRGRASYGGGMSGGVSPAAVPVPGPAGSSPPGSPTRSGARFQGVRGRHTVSLGRVHTGGVNQ